MQNTTLRDADYAHAIIQTLPELCGHLAALTLPSGGVRDGQPVAPEPRRIPLRGAPLDDLDAVFRELYNSVDYWQDKLAQPHWLPTGHMVRHDEHGEVLGPRLVITEDWGIDSITSWARILVERLTVWWPAISEHDDFDGWASNVDEWFANIAARWPLDGRQPVRQHPRECGTCGQHDVLADPLVPGQALCRSCWTAYVPEEWVTLAEASPRLGKSKATLERWLVSESATLTVKRRGSTRLVELGQLRRLAREMDARNPAVKVAR